MAAKTLNKITPKDMPAEDVKADVVAEVTDVKVAIGVDVEKILFEQAKMAKLIARSQVI